MAKRVLVVDSSALARRGIRSLLNAAGFEVLEATSGSDLRENFSALRAMPVDFILLDIAFPDEDGFQIIEWLRSQAETAEVPVIIISGDVSRESILRGLLSGAVDYIAKPFNPDDLLRRISQYLPTVRPTPGPGVITWHFQEYLSRELKRATRHRRPLSLALGTIRVFDSDLEEVPLDNLLESVVLLVSRTLRESDTVVRFGPREFVVILPETDPGGARFVKEKLQRLTLSYQKGTDTRLRNAHPVIGTATFPGDGLTREALIEAARRDLQAQLA